MALGASAVQFHMENPRRAVAGAPKSAGPQAGAPKRSMPPPPPATRGRTVPPPPSGLFQMPQTNATISYGSSSSEDEEDEEDEANEADDGEEESSSDDGDGSGEDLSEEGSDVSEEEVSDDVSDGSSMMSDMSDSGESDTSAGDQSWRPKWETKKKAPAPSAPTESKAAVAAALASAAPQSRPVEMEDALDALEGVTGRLESAVAKKSPPNVLAARAKVQAEKSPAAPSPGRFAGNASTSSAARRRGPALVVV